MPKTDLKNMDVDALLALRADVGKALAERSRDLERQLALLGGEVSKRGGKPAERVGRPSVMKGKKVAPKYRGPDGETWAGRGAMPRWLAALVKEGHSVEEFLIGSGRKRAAAAAKKVVKSKRKAGKPGTRKRRHPNNERKREVATAS
jgi:DNA-binding protein H-NS